MFHDLFIHCILWRLIILWASRLIILPLKNFTLIWKRHHCRWKAAKFRPMFSHQSLWAGRDIYRATPSVTRGLRLPGLIRRTAPFSRLILLYTMRCEGPILTRILKGSELSAFTSFFFSGNTKSSQYISTNRKACYMKN
jgi:hypothetical protein